MRCALQSRWCWAAVGLCVVASGVAADEAQQSDKPDASLERWMALYRQSAESVDMFLAEDRERPLDRHEAPLLKYTNPVRRVQQHGAVYVWTIQERPAVIASFWSAMPQPDMRRLNFEWHSLHEGPLRAERDGERLWDTQEAGLDWSVLADVAPPAALRPQRLVQMRRIASSFAVEIHTEESELRLMPQPLFRYSETAEGVIDGAIFAFVMGTDPELFLLVEARPAENGTEQWHVGFVRFTNQPLTVRRDGREWWSCPLVPVRVGAVERTGKYYLHLEVERLPAELGDNVVPSDAKQESRAARSRSGVAALGIAAAVLAASLGMTNDDTPSAASQTDREALLAFLSERAGTYTLAGGEDGASTFERTPEPILRYTALTREFLHGGAMFLWLDGERPVAAGSIWVRSDGTSTREFSLLIDEPLVCHDESGVVVWAPERGQLVDQPLPDAPAPAKSKALRLAQMRNLARRFSATVYRRQDGDPSELRLLPQPVYRYSAARDGIVDASIFALAESNDPDLLVTITARAGQGAGPDSWTYSLARMCSMKIAARLEAAEVHTFPDYWINPRTRQDSYLEAVDGKFQLPAD